MDNRSFLQKAFDQINVFDYGKSWGNAGRSAGPKPPPVRPVTRPGGSSDFAREIRASQARTDSLLAELRGLQAQVAQQPRLPYFDVAGNWRRAQARAASAVNPLYKKKMRDFVGRQTQLKKRKQAEVKVARGDIQDILSSALEESGIARERTTEDVARELGILGRQEDTFQTSTGMEAEESRRALLSGLAESGLTTSGLGRQQEIAQRTVRNLGEGEQVAQFNDQRTAQNLLKTRTFADLERRDTSAQTSATKARKKVDVDLESFLADQKFEKQQFTFSNEAERLQAVLSDAERRSQLGVNKFISSLLGSARPQDIALAKQVYG